MATFRGMSSALCVLGVSKLSFFVAGGGSREVVTLGEGECCCATGIGVLAAVVFEGWNLKTAWLSWRKTRTKRAFSRLDT